MDERFVVITPARNEADYLEQTIKSVVSQTILPSEWIIVDDGSRDKTALIAEKASQAHPWIKVVRLEDRGYRDLYCVLVVDVIYEGIKNIDADYEFLFNIDADIVLSPDYFEIILNTLRANPKLGIASGVVYEKFRGKLIKMKGLSWPTSGAIKCWRRKCFEEIGGLVRGLAWEVLDCFRALMLGWQTQAFEDERLKVIHLRLEGSADQRIFHKFVRRGRSHHFMASHPLWLLATAFYHMQERPYILGGVGIIIGYLEAILERSKQLWDHELKRYLRKWQIKKLTQILRLR